MFQMKHLAENIRKYRSAKKLTQTELAAILKISPQSVSKWECAQAVPEIENLCLMAKMLGVSVDQLLGCDHFHGEDMIGIKVMIGIDGGGSKTEFVMFAEDGTIFERLVLGACNPNAVGIEESAALLQQGIEELMEFHRDVCGIYVGSSGFFTGGNGKKIRSILSRVYPEIKIRCETDIMNVIASGTDEESCIAVICGTGSIVFAKEREKLTKLSGWGFLLSSSGSGYDIGRDALRAALGDTEGLAEKTRITPLVETKLGAPVMQCVQEVYQHDQSYVASFTPLVFKAYHQGDAAAERILRENAKSLARVINHAARNYDCGKRIILSGGLLTGNEVFRQMVCDALDPDLAVTVPSVPQVLGACRLCAKMCGVDVSKMDEKLISQYHERGQYDA